MLTFYCSVCASAIINHRSVPAILDLNLLQFHTIEQCGTSLNYILLVMVKRNEKE